MLSVIIPTYNEEKTLETAVRSLRDFFNENGQDFELIIVDDGSRDKTCEVARSLEGEVVRVFSYPKNWGKGYALKFGFEKSRGDRIVFFDSGLDFPPSQIADLLEILEKNDVGLVIGSKRHPESEVDYPWHRRLVSFGAQTLIKFLFGLGVTDTQVGLKVFRREVLERVMPLVLVKKYAFDVEVLALAHHYHFKIKEAPVRLRLAFSTAVGPRSLFETLFDTLSIFYRLKVIHFYDLSEEERQRLLARYPVNPFDRFLTRIFRGLRQR